MTMNTTPWLADLSVPTLTTKNELLVRTFAVVLPPTDILE